MVIRYYTTGAGTTVIGTGTGTVIGTGTVTVETRKVHTNVNVMCRVRLLTLFLYFGDDGLEICLTVWWQHSTINHYHSTES